MSDFKKFRALLQDHFNDMVKSGNPLFITDADEDELYNLYLDSFPAGTNELFRKRREYDCSCCRRFVKNIGKLVAFDKDYNLISIWDFDAKSAKYQPVVDALAAYMKNRTIVNPYFVSRNMIGSGNMFGTEMNYDCLRSIAFELNLGTPFAEAIKDLNIINMNETSYKLTVLFKDGYRTSCTKRLDLFNGAQRIYFEVKLKDGFWPDCYINTEDIQCNPANGEQFIDGKKVDVINPYSKSEDDEKDRYEAFEKDNGVVKVIISRARERDIHYMV